MKKIPDKQFYILKRDFIHGTGEYVFTKVDGHSIRSLSNAPKSTCNVFDLFWHKNDFGLFLISSGKCGLLLARGHTLKEAKTELSQKIWTYSVGVGLKNQQEDIKTYGISPRWR